MKLYTGNGDKGMTRLLTGEEVPKNHVQVRAKGTIDELGAWIGLCRVLASAHLKSELAVVLRLLFNCGHDLSVSAHSELFKVTKEDVAWLEQTIDGYAFRIPDKFQFALASGNELSSYFNVARTICRRAERELSALRDAAGVNLEVLAAMNRLSDYFYALFRALDQDELLL